MEIIKHGNLYEAPMERECPDCKCVISYVENDLEQIRVWVSAYDSDLTYTYINCPECGKTIII